MTNNGRRVVIFIGTKITKQKYNNLFLKNLHLLCWHANISKRDVTMKNKTNILNYWRVSYHILLHDWMWVVKNFWRYTLHILVYAVKNNCDLMVWIFSTPVTLYQEKNTRRLLYESKHVDHNNIALYI